MFAHVGQFLNVGESVDCETMLLVKGMTVHQSNGSVCVVSARELYEDVSVRRKKMMMKLKDRSGGEKAHQRDWNERSRKEGRKDGDEILLY